MEVLTRLGENLDAVFPGKKVLIVNMRKLMWVVIKYSLATHIMTCIFLMVQYQRNEETVNKQTLKAYGYIPTTAEEILHVTTPEEILVAILYYYVESLYFIVMT